MSDRDPVIIEPLADFWRRQRPALRRKDIRRLDIEGRINIFRINGEWLVQSPSSLVGGLCGTLTTAINGKTPTAGKLSGPSKFGSHGYVTPRELARQPAREATGTGMNLKLPGTSCQTRLLRHALDRPIMRAGGSE
jgi:hypothetical protein